MAKLTIELRPDEREALQKSAHSDPRDQAAVIVVRELEHAGPLPTSKSLPEVESAHVRA